MSAGSISTSWLEPERLDQPRKSKLNLLCTCSYRSQSHISTDYYDSMVYAAVKCHTKALHGMSVAENTSRERLNNSICMS